MFQEKVQKRLKLLTVGKNQPVEISKQSFHLIETGEGEADLEVSFSHSCVLFRDLEHKKLQYFQNKKCADYVIFENRGDSWYIHIFELKRTVTSTNWKEIKLQFMGALQNALALAGVIGIEIDPCQSVLYTVYRNDKINDAANPAKAHLEMHTKGGRPKDSEVSDWNVNKVLLNFTEDINMVHQKIPLDIKTGKASYQL